MRRGLSLKRETLTELTTADLAEVAGAQWDPSISCPLVRCVTDMFETFDHCLPTNYCPTLFC